MKNQTNQLKKALLKGLSSACLLLAAPFVMQGVAQNDETPEVKVSNTLTYTQQFDLRYKAIPLRVPTGYLYDRVYPFAALDQKGECDTTEPYDIYQAWSEFERSAVLPDLPKTYDAMRERVNLSLLGNVIPIIGYDVRLAQIDTMAFEQGRIIQEGETMTDAGLESPYNVFHAQGLGIAQTEFYSDVTYTFVFNPENFLSNSGAVVKRIAIHRPGFEVVWLNPNKPWTVTGLEGNEPWRIEAELENDPRKLCGVCKRESVGPYVPRAIGNCKEGELHIIESEIPFMGLLEDEATTSIGEARFYYRKTSTGKQCKLHKPIIILDGFDPLDDRKPSDILELFGYKSIDNSKKNLSQELRQKGFDVVILNFPVLGSEFINRKSEVKAYSADGQYLGMKSKLGRDGGADYIQRNAFVLVKLLQEINQQLALNGSPEELVIIGPSMGGLISRYALAYMEKQDSLGVPNMKHNTRLWLSFDAPHQGANIGLGTQVVLDYNGNKLENVELKDRFEKELRSIAARQLLVKDTNFYNRVNYRSRELHELFYKSVKDNGIVNSFGYPIKLRKVSLLNGTLTGERTFLPCDFDVFIEATRNNKHLLKLVIRHAPEFKQECMVAEIEHVGELEVLGAKVPYGYNRVPVKFTNDESTKFLDFVPGSYFDEKQGLAGKIAESVKKISKATVSAHYDVINGTFIPSYSAMDLKPGFNFNDNMSELNLVCNGSTPFDAYYAPSQNQKHIFLDHWNVAWAIQEIDKGDLPCKAICVETDYWPSSICNGGYEEFEVIGLQNIGAHGYRWSVDGSNLKVKEGHTRSKAVIEANRNSKDIYGHVYATITRPCAGDFVIKRRVEIPSVEAKIEGPDNICSEERAIFSLQTETPVINPFWYFSDANGIHSEYSPYGADLPMPLNANNTSPYLFTSAYFGGKRTGSYRLHAQAYNYCMEKIDVTKDVNILPVDFCSKQNKLDGEQLQDLEVFPNPSADLWNVISLQQGKGQVSKYVLTDMSGRTIVVHDFERPQSFITVQVAGLQNGIYILDLLLTSGERKSVKLIKN